MNKQELKKHIEGLPYRAGLIVDTIKINRNGLLKLIEQLDEPQKPAVPQFVADWIEECKNDDFHLFGAMEEMSLHQKKLDYWFREDDNMELFARAWLDGYTVEEKRYLVKMKDITISTRYLKHNMQSGNWFLSEHKEAFPYRTKHTRKELERANFGWVFDCPGIEIEEVE